MASIIYELKEGCPNVRKVAEYSLPPKEAMVCFIEQTLKGNLNTWEYPEEIAGMRESDTIPDHWYYDVFRGRNGNVNAVYSSYPADSVTDRLRRIAA